MRLLLFGCSGFIGRELTSQLLEEEHELTLVSRQSPERLDQRLKDKKFFHVQLDPSNPSSWEEKSLLNALADAEGIINLAGEPIAEQRWTPTNCKRIRNSRITTTKLLVDAMSELKKAPRVLLNASAIGYYGTSEDAQFTEESQSGKDFLASVCQEWEASASKKPKKTRLIILRIGIVLGPEGGALAKMLPVFKAGFGGPLGNGQQWMSWIQRTDLCEMIKQGLSDKTWSGVINAVAPNPVKMSEFASTLGKTIGRPSLLTVPGPILKFLLGDGAKVVLEGQKVSSKRLKVLKFSFKYPSLKEALSVSTKS